LCFTFIVCVYFFFFFFLREFFSYMQWCGAHWMCYAKKEQDALAAVEERERERVCVCTNR